MSHPSIPVVPNQLRSTTLSSVAETTQAQDELELDIAQQTTLPLDSPSNIAEPVPGVSLDSTSTTYTAIGISSIHSIQHHDVRHQPHACQTHLDSETGTGCNFVVESGSQAAIEYSPPIPEITLRSRLRTSPNFSLWTLVAVSVGLTSFSVYYGWNVSFSSLPSTDLLWAQPDTTIFTVNLLSYFTTVLVCSLITSTCDHIRWSKCCQQTGLDYLSFLALSPNTSILGLIHLLCSPSPRVKSGVFRNTLRGHRLWAFQRYSPLGRSLNVAFSCTRSKRPWASSSCLIYLSTQYIHPSVKLGDSSR